MYEEWGLAGASFRIAMRTRGVGAPSKRAAAWKGPLTRLPILRLDAAQPASPRGHEFRKPPAHRLPIRRRDSVREHAPNSTDFDSGRLELRCRGSVGTNTEGPRSNEGGAGSCRRG